MPTILTKLFELNKFKETGIGLLISYGGFSAFLPKILESAGSINGTTSFDFLTWFALFYFLLPCFFFLTYWSFLGFIPASAKKRQHSEMGHMLNQFDYKWIFFAVRIAPFLLFFSDKFIFHWGTFQNSSFVIILWYALIGIFEFYFLTKRIGLNFKKYTLAPILFQSALKYGLLLSFLNIVLGIGFLYLSEPWFLFRDNMILILWSIIFLYAIIVSYLFLDKTRKLGVEKADLRFLLAPVLLIFSLTYLMPHVNRSIKIFSWSFDLPVGSILFDTLIFITFLLLLLGFVVLAFNYNLQKIKQLHKIVAARIKALSAVELLILIGFLLVPFFFQGMIEYENAEYYKRRVKAAENITDRKLVPSFENIGKDNIDQQIAVLDFIHKHNHLFYLRGNWSNIEDEPIRFFSLVDKYDTNLVNFLFTQENDIASDTLINASFFKENKTKLIRMRSFFYGSYDKDAQNIKPPSNQKEINAFYSNLFTNLKGTVFPKTIIPLSYKSKEYGVLVHYLHPLNFYSYVVDHYESQTELLKRIQLNIKYLRTLNSFLDLPTNTAHLKNTAISTEKKELFHKINTQVNSIVEFQGTGLSLSEDKLDLYESYLSEFLPLKQNQYTDRIKNAQAIYQSYLFDYQRIGLFLFLLQVILFGTVYLESRKEVKRIKELKERIDSENNPDYEIDKEEIEEKLQSLNPVFIALVTILALMFPLMREIKAENIDPTKRFWMLNLSNWYSPELVFPSSSSRPSPKREEPNTQSPPAKPNFQADGMEKLRNLERRVQLMEVNIDSLELKKIYDFNQLSLEIDALKRRRLLEDALAEVEDLEE
ncbi:hypothetical protein [Mongoliitalea daihaiensis]|uniref:hypothetical protein n=1 Tax=Mongoliitalea daihaiensis TaxID=2782006 RepID=UPI001F387629|nr:hypothetical protein [Mongoliitalea daihaiensis]UJP64416.1 hypothetical protein IPZ59_16645 [Mongoliitalea daihaiensis]